MADPATAATTAPKPKEEKITPPDPPLRIKDKERGWVYTRVGFLGEGGFARVWEVVDQKGNHRAIKVVCKSNIRTKKNKTKLWAEIKLHQMLKHPHIVRFDDCFEDEENVYMVLELCDHGSMLDLLKRRKRYTEPEARYYMIQIIAACQYMHQTNVIHRDLKLGNLFLDEDMNVKVGDFGLAALIEKPGDRKKTICGTPNYIAPEVLFDTANGHSFEVDVWSVGVILYTLLIGRPPFQTKDVKAIYKRIKENRYEFPIDKEISDTAKDLIMSILNRDPERRPSLNAILTHSWFFDGPFPPLIPVSSNDVQPSFRHLLTTQSRANYKAVCQKAKIGSQASINTDATKPRTALGPSIMQQERDFKNAVQPDSPISALLNSARQPLVQAPSQIKEPSLLRKLTAAGAQATLSPARRTAVSNIGKENRGPVAAINGNAKPGPSRAPMGQVQEEEEVLEEEEEEQTEEEDLKQRGYDAGVRERELANQKARIVSQMAKERVDGEPVERRTPRKVAAAPATVSAGLSPARTVEAQRREAAPSGTTGKMGQVASGRVSLFDVFADTLDRALSSPSTFSTPHIEENPDAPSVFVVSWLDYCTKYGMGFAMTDGTVSVHFNDSSSLVLAPGKGHFDHIQPSSSSSSEGASHRRNFLIDQYPKDLHNKVYLLKHFESYMLERLMGKHDYVYSDTGLKHGMVFITRYLRMKHVILFRLSNDVLQFNFYDHTKLILSRDGAVVSIIDKHYVLRTWSLEDLIRPLDTDASERDKKRVEGVLHKVQYARDVLFKIQAHASSRSKATATTTASTVSSGTTAISRPIR